MPFANMGVPMFLRSVVLDSVFLLAVLMTTSDSDEKRVALLQLARGLYGLARTCDLRMWKNIVDMCASSS